MLKVKAVADSSKKSLKKAQSLGVEKLYTDYHELLAHSSEMDAIIISLPNFLHFESVKLSLENGLNIFVEKPMANTVKECPEVVKFMKKSGRILMVGHCMRFIEVVENLEVKMGHIQ